MRNTLSDTLFRRETRTSQLAARSYRKIYSDRRLIDDLDIVNELDGHSGCVNALSWSKSGGLLASGSDDQHLNIYAYQPTAVNSQFQLATTVATGHTQNIFSVKFMPHSQDNTVITAAGDGEVRIFDLEYAGQATAASAASHNATEGRRRGRSTLFNDVKYMNDGDTNCRVYRSHGDRVKRIVTESSPHLFLTCSEDGEVRQWDLRLPSSSYPSPRGMRSGGNEPIPPPLISYRHYNLDLNTISCSASQPHYIALGGAHLHAFLHDRRMSGRDRLREAGVPLGRPENLSAEDQRRLAEATRCVRKFAPQGQQRMSQSDSGHITACKISDARPDEMVVSWSGDQIYAFDLIRDDKVDSKGTRSSRKGRVRESREGKRKRRVTGSEASLGQEAASRAQPRQNAGEGEGTSDATLRIRYRNGQSEDVALRTPEQLTTGQRDAQRIAQATVRVRSAIFGARSHDNASHNQFAQALGICSSVMSDMDEMMKDWGYPMEPSPEQVYVQRTLRRCRESTHRFMQTAGTLARVLGGTLQTVSGPSPLLGLFIAVEVSNNHLELTTKERFCYDFIKAILLWLDSGIGRLIEGFTRPIDMRSGSRAGSRLPIPEADATTEAIDEYLIPYLLAMADDNPIIDMETNRFETAERRSVFPNQKAAVIAFASATRIPFADLSSAVMQVEGEDNVQAQDRQTAHRFWASRVARGLLLHAGEGLTFAVVDRAFGGIGRVTQAAAADEAALDELGAGGDNDELDILGVDVVQEGLVTDGANAEDIAGAVRQRSGTQIERDGNDDDSNSEDGLSDDAAQAESLARRDHGYSVIVEDEDEDDEDDDADEDEDIDYDDDEDDYEIDDNEDEEVESSDPDEEDGVPNIDGQRFFYRTAYERRRMKPQVEADVPCSAPLRSYRGHCNVRTVKDVNYLGPDDEYVVSGSDDGNFFIWDRKSGRLINILEGDGEVVNVVQGHPYETMLAVSGIDHTIKIFSPDARARQVARLGQGVSAHDAASFSSLSWPIRAHRYPIGNRRRQQSQHDTSAPALSAEQQGANAEEDEQYVAANGLTSRRRFHDRERITQNNDSARQGGNQEAVITVSLNDFLKFLATRTVV